MTHFLPTTNPLAARDDDHTIEIPPKIEPSWFRPAGRMTTPWRYPADVVCGSRIRYRWRTCRIC